MITEDRFPESRLERCQRLCRERGLSMTVQRRAILEELVSRRDHPTADQVYESVRSQVPGLSRTTVYRVLDTFVDVGAARKVFHPDAVARFDPITERHHHLICQRCGELTDADVSEKEGLPLEELGIEKLLGGGSIGFQITDYSINFTGICSDCRDQTGGRERDHGN